MIFHTLFFNNYNSLEKKNVSQQSYTKGLINLILSSIYTEEEGLKVHWCTEQLAKGLKKIYENFKEILESLKKIYV